MLVCRSRSRETWPCDQESGEQQQQGSQEAGGRLTLLETLRAKRKGTSPRQCSSRQDRGRRSASDWSQGQHLSFSTLHHTHTHVWSCLHSLVTLSLSSVTPGHSRQSLIDFKPASYTAVMAHCEITNGMCCFEKTF